MSAKTIKDLFGKEITRRIEEVIKVDQTDEAILVSGTAQGVSPESPSAFSPTTTQ